MDLLGLCKAVPKDACSTPLESAPHPNLLVVRDLASPVTIDNHPAVVLHQVGTDRGLPSWVVVIPKEGEVGRESASHAEH